MPQHHRITGEEVVVTAALGKFYTPPDGWTTDDLDALPEDGVRRELIDGVLHVSPSPTTTHQIVTLRLGTALEETCPAGYQVTLGVEIRISKRRSFIPDLLIADAAAVAPGPSQLQPRDVLLAVEVVSPSSPGMDRLAKPGFYAEAGIPFYWRIETEPVLSVHTYLLDPTRNTYGSIGDFAKEIDLLEPWEIKIPIKRLLPRFMTGSVDGDPDRGGEDDLA
jgi:Uma2 family endonuclease